MYLLAKLDTKTNRYIRANLIVAPVIAIAVLVVTACGVNPHPGIAQAVPAPVLVAQPLRAKQPDKHELRVFVVREEAKRAGVPVAMALAVSYTENWGGDSLAVSKAGAVGIMQVMPNVWGQSFAKECGDDPLTALRRNACVGVRILKYYHERHENWNQALRAYNGSLRMSKAGDDYVAKVMERLQLTDD